MTSPELPPEMSIKDLPWFSGAELQEILALLNGDGGEARLVGGVVRNALLDLPISDFDIATTLSPQQVIARAEAGGVKWVPTGIDHGTVTLVVRSIPFEVTTLRVDVTTDGRRAAVSFTDDWKADAERRDFTINALYADRNGTIHDDVGGLADLKTGTVRFIGAAADRIAEDHLRILRFFRFFAHYGRGRPDGDGLKACAAAKGLLQNLSAERIWNELFKLFLANDPGRALLWMRTTGVLTAVLPETEKWGIDAIPALVEAEQAFNWPIDPLLRLAAIVPPDAERLEKMAARLRMSRGEGRWFADFATAPAIAETLDKPGLAKLFYQFGTQGLQARLKLMLASLRQKDQTSLDGLRAIHRLSDFIAMANNWTRPVFPVKGSDLMAMGRDAGPKLGETLKRLEAAWLQSDFTLDKDQLLALA